MSQKQEIQENQLRNSADLCKLVETLGYKGAVINQLQLSNGAFVSSLLAFFDDNPGAIEAVADWAFINLPLEGYEDEDDDEEAMKLEIEKVLVVSTAHITQKDNNLLQIVGATITVYNCEYFYLIYLSENILESIGEMFSPAFKKLIEFAKNHEEGFTHLKLDRDGDTLEGFEEFDW